jgi:site-specific DNA-methyltransferase (adenine-specific)
VRHRSTKRRAGNELSTKLLRRVLEISTREGDLVFDPFGGSGTTYAAAQEMGRRWVGCEIGDCAPIVRRLRGEDADVAPPRRGDAAKGLTAQRRMRGARARLDPPQTDSPQSPALPPSPEAGRADGPDLG